MSISRNLKTLLLLFLLAACLIPELIRSGDWYDLISVMPFGRQIFGMLATILDFSSKVPELGTTASLSTEILKLFFVSVIKRFMEVVFFEALEEDREGKNNVLMRLIVNVAIVCLASVFFKAVWDLMKTGGIVVLILVLLAANCIASAAMGYRKGMHGVIGTLFVELLSEIAQTLFVMIIVIGGFLLFVNPGSQTLFTTGLLFIILGTGLLMGLQLLLDL